MDDNIQLLLKALGLKGLLSAFEELTETERNKISHAVFVSLLESEKSFRQSRSFMYRLDKAKLPQIKTFEDFDFKNADVDTKKIETLLTADFISKHENIILQGGTGSGKSHIGNALAYKAIQIGYKVHFVKFNTLARNLLEANSERDALRYMQRLQHFNLLVIDELGYLPVDKQAGVLLFELFSACYEKNSLLITTSLEFKEWGDIFGNKKATKAMIDRLTHHAQLIYTGEESWRLRSKNTK
jgi:DNA replication protein DnaC